MSAWLWGVVVATVVLALIVVLERLGIARARRRIRDDARLFVEDRAEWERRHSLRRPAWIRVSVDPEGFRVEASPPGKPYWAVDVAWPEVVRVCVVRAGLEGDDGLYVFRAGQEESIALPLATDGAMDLLEALTSRGLFPRDKLLAALTGPSPGMTCHPQEVGHGREPDRDAGMPT